MFLLIQNALDKTNKQHLLNKQNSTPSPQKTQNPKKQSTAQSELLAVTVQAFVSPRH